MRLHAKRIILLSAIVVTVFACWIWQRPGSKPPLSPSVQIQLLEQPRKEAGAAGASDELDSLRSDVIARACETMPTQLVPLRVRIGRDVQCLRGESVEDSLRRLDRVSMFYWPGIPGEAGAVKLPLSDDEEQNVCLRICSNRRFMKLLEQLGELDRQEAGRLVAVQIRETLDTYRAAFARHKESLLAVQASKPSGWEPECGPSYAIEDNPDGSPTLAGLRLKLLAMASLAGNLELTEAASAVEDLAVEARAQQRELMAGPLPLASRFSMMRNAGLSNRSILVTALRGVNAKAAGIADQAHLSAHVIEMTHYDAIPSPFDQLTRGGGPIPPDFTKGRLRASFVGHVSDAQLDAVLDVCRTNGK